MNKKFLIILCVLTLLLSACGDLPMKNTDKTNPSNSENSPIDEDSETEEVITNEVNENIPTDTNTQVDANANNETQDVSETPDLSGMDAMNGLPVGIAMDLSEPENLMDYSSGLVFVLKEDDLWRVVDRTGSVYRASTSFEDAGQGLICHEARVAKTDSGEINLKLEYAYSISDKVIVAEGPKNEVPEIFANKLLEQYQETTNSADLIEEYSIITIEVSSEIGKGIQVVHMKFEVKPVDDNSLWGQKNEDGFVQDLEFDFAIFGYEDTWVLPSYQALYEGI